MANGFTLQSFQSAIVTQIPSLASDPNFQTILPDMLDYSELSIQRDLDLFASHGLQALGNLSTGTPTFTVPNNIVLIEQMFYTPASGGRVPIVPCSDVALNYIYGAATAGPPKVWNYLPMTQANDQTSTLIQQIEVGPSPDQAYPLVAFATS